MQVVQQKYIDSTVEGARRDTNVRLDRLGVTGRKNDGSLDGQVDQGKRRRLLQSAVLEDLEVAGGEILHERAPPIGHDRVDFNEVDLTPEGDLRGERRRVR